MSGLRCPRRPNGAGTVLCTALLSVCQALASDPPVLRIPALDAPPTLENFLKMRPSREWAGKLAKVEGFVQSHPSDGSPSTQRTEVFTGYDAKSLYVVFVAFDSEPERIRARMSRRESLNNDDDWVEVALDTFNDQRRAYLFDCNPLGVQWDALWTEGSGEDSSFDTVWNSRGVVTDRGYVVWMSVPFKSLRFPNIPNQTWRIQFRRWIPRTPELVAWPHISTKIEGRLNQAALLVNLSDISPGRNVQVIPYATFRSFRALDARDAGRPIFVRDLADPDAGLDAKFVLEDSLVLDMTVNPDFSQVESDDPQVTANERFEVFFPEKRPFFLENANFFQTPINLVFSRRIADPLFGARMTGRAGPYAIGALLADDESPGKTAPDEDPLFGSRALFGIVRVSRDILEQSSIGFIYVDRELEEGYNRVGGVDARLKLSANWVTAFQAVASGTRSPGGRRLSGPAYQATLQRVGRQFNYDLSFQDISPGFRAESGFVPRTDIRQITQSVAYRFRPEGDFLIAWGPRLRTTHVWDHSGIRLDWSYDVDMSWELTGQTETGFWFFHKQERLRPSDFPALAANRDFSQSLRGFFISSSRLPRVTLGGSYGWGERINYVPPIPGEPALADWRGADLRIDLRPSSRLRIENTYSFLRLGDRTNGGTILNNHLLRSKWNWQFNRELSIRLILDYEALLSNPDATSLQPSKRVRGDLLISYLVNPWTAFFVGFNSSAADAALDERGGVSPLHRPGDWLNDANQFFVKLSYLFRF